MKSNRQARAAVAIAATALVMVICAQGCVVHGRGGGVPFVAGMFTAMALHHAIVLHHHDHHYHDEFCGHRRVWVEDRWLYWYGDHWEYFDYSNERWYAVPASPPQDHEGAEGPED
ncbi:MAG: hypothetical protein HY897_11730 [Deltaproteobacteria bacterium]|nr:hypothetical protein [Deltaproteobacteria bacterium]